MMPNPYQQYQATQVQTASTGELVVLLYDGAVRFLNRGRLALVERRYDIASEYLLRGQEIILELLAGLDFERGGELAGNLRDLYLFMHGTLVEANVRKDAEKVQTVIGLLDTIREAWREVVRGGRCAPAGAVE
jgi:flagellar protein FliS